MLFTTSNFPDILFPFWKVDNSSGIFFVGFLLIGLYMLLNLMLAVFYNSYKAQVERKIAKYDSLREEFLRKEFRAIGASPERDYVTTTEFRTKYGAKVIGQSEKVQQLLGAIDNEREVGLSDDRVYYADFAYMYMFLEFADQKRQVRKSVKAIKAAANSSNPSASARAPSL